TPTADPTYDYSMLLMDTAWADVLATALARWLGVTRLAPEFPATPAAGQARPAPVTADGMKISTETDFEALAESALRGEAPLSIHPDDASPLEPLERLYAKLKGTPYQDALSRGIAQSLTSKHKEVRK